MDSDRADLDEFSDDELPHAPASLSERRRAQKAKFEAWLTSPAALEALSKKPNRDAKIEDAADEDLSIEKLMAKQGTQIIKNPRQYQWELFQRAQVQNTIAVLDTGSGKTLIAVLLLKWIVDQELERRAAGNPPKLAFFLVASVTLVYQQFAVLQQNLDHSIARVCGADGVDNWTKGKWEQLLHDNKIIVATADVLHQALAHGYVTMNRINLLIFDEAHHAKKNHGYARIVKDFYVSEKKADRPRIFGMTASPVDAKTDVLQAANELESLLDSRIATTTDMSLTDTIKKPEESVVYYSALPNDRTETPLVKSIRDCFIIPVTFERMLGQTAEISRHLGRWCADCYLVDALSEPRQKRYEMDADKKHYYHSLSQHKLDHSRLSEKDNCGSLAQNHVAPGVKERSVSALDADQASIREIIDFVRTQQTMVSLTITEAHFSCKVLELRRLLSLHFERPCDHRCIVFVEARHTARLLTAAFVSFGLENVRPGYLIGSGSPELDEDNFTHRMQIMTLMKFRNGDINCLFATTVGEEGLDVPDCNLVIRFDMYRTMIQYVQSRGRARQKNSRFIHMLEKDNSVHVELLTQVRYQEREMRRFCEALPDDRRLEGNDDHLVHLLSKERNLRVYIEPSTGAKLTYGNSLAYLANFVSAIPTENEEMLQPVYYVNAHGSKFQAEVVLPGNAPIPSAIGKICTKKTLAKRSAAFEACLELRRRAYMNEHLMPIYQKAGPIMRNAMLAVGMKKCSSYTMKTKPSVWEQARGILPSELYMTVINFPDGLEYPNQPLALLTRTPMPELPAFPVYLNDGRASTVNSIALAHSLHVDERSLRRLSVFTFRIFKDVFSKRYDYQPEQLSYWLAPLLHNASIPDTCACPSSLLDIHILDEVFTHEEYKWTPDIPADGLVGKFVVDPWDGGRKFYSSAICPHLTPLDRVPQDAAKAKWNANILDYSNSLFRKAREAREGTWNLNQPVFEAAVVLHRRNMLAPPDTKEVTLRKKAYLCPEPLRISALPPALVTSCFVWPAIIHRIESHLIALEAAEMIGIQCSPQTALAAVTKDSENSSDREDIEQVNFQRGMGENYERLEFIGDTFLKTATTISTFVQNPNDNEFEFHVKRMTMLCNKNLFIVAKDLRLYEYIRSIAFSRRLWYPEGLKLLQGKGVKKEDVSDPAPEQMPIMHHSLGEKTIADVCEALIGAAYVTHDRPDQPWQPSHWENAVRAVTKLVRSNDHLMQKWSDYSAAYEKPAYQTGEVSASQRDLAEKVEREHPYRFRYPRLLRSAFIHPSQPLMYEKIPNYQRLEFLGDALLDMASITYLFYRYPNKDPQWLTEHKMAMVSNKFLGAVCVDIGFHKHLRHSSPALPHQIDAYATELLEAKRTAGDSKDYWTTVSDPPKCLPDIVESFVGAMFVDSDFDYNVVQKFFDLQIKPYFVDMNLYDTFANNHPCTHLHNLMQQTYGCRDYRLMAKELPGLDPMARNEIVAAVMVHDEIVAYSKGKSGRYARLRAAKEALEVILGLPPVDFRARFKCECLTKAEGKEEVEETMAADCGA